MHHSHSFLSNRLRISTLSENHPVHGATDAVKETTDHRKKMFIDWIIPIGLVWLFHSISDRLMQHMNDVHQASCRKAAQIERSLQMKLAANDLQKNQPFFISHLIQSEKHWIALFYALAQQTPEEITWVDMRSHRHTLHCVGKTTHPASVIPFLKSLTHSFVKNATLLTLKPATEPHIFLFECILYF